jgi:DNA-binding NtrC family response regulator
MEAMTMLAETGARIVLLDIDMPGKDGHTLLQEIKQLDGGVQVIMCTGLVSMHTILRSIELGVEACIFKPIVDLSEISQAVERAFEKIDRFTELEGTEEGDRTERNPCGRYGIRTLSGRSKRFRQSSK